MTEFRDRQTSSKSGLAAELKNLVGESLQNSANTFLRGLNLFKTAACYAPREKVGVLAMAKYWARINLETSRIVSRHTQEAVNEILDVLEQCELADSSAQKASCAQSQPKPEGKVAIRLTARRGQKATTLFAVSNPGPNPMAATFAVSDFVNEDNHIVKNATVTFTPDRIKLAANQEAAVEVTIDVSEKFRVDKCYQATVDIPEYSGKKILLQLNVIRASAATTAKKKKA
jgi:hypothetical protein